jgi:hypothetical protein
MYNVGGQQSDVGSLLKSFSINFDRFLDKTNIGLINLTQNKTKLFTYKIQIE